MGFKRIVVEFDEHSSVRRVIALPNKGVQAIFLDGAATELLKNPIEATEKVPDGLVVESQLADDGIGPSVCYLVNGQMVCW